LKILCYHFAFRQGSQFARLGQCRPRSASPLSDGWAAWAATKIARLVLRTPILRNRPCYWRSQIIYDLLPRFGFAAQLHLGVRLDEDKPATHLWVSLAGQPLVEERDCAVKYVELAVYKPDITHD
jgi:hypothetical protein